MKRPNRQQNEENGRSLPFDRLFDEYSPRVMGYLLHLTGSRSDAEDLTQETFLAAYRGQNGFKGRSKPLTWLIGIARRRWRDSGRTTVATAPLDEGKGSSEDFANRMALAATLSAAMERLTEPEREVLLLTAIQGFSYREAAEVLEEPVSTVKWRVYEATKQLRQILNAAEERYEARYGSETTKTTNEQGQCLSRIDTRTDGTSCRR